LLLDWPGAASIGFIPFAIYRVSRIVRGGSSLTPVVVSAVPLFSILVTFQLVSLTNPPPSSLAAFTPEVYRALLGVVSAWSYPTLTAAGVVFYVTLLLYASSSNAGRGGQQNWVVVLAIAATLLCVGWVWAISTVHLPLPYLQEAFPVGLIGLTWWLGRAR